MSKNPTIATVAAHAGVAVSTVSRYLNGRAVYFPHQFSARLVERDYGLTGLTFGASVRDGPDVEPVFWPVIREKSAVDRW